MFDALSGLEKVALLDWVSAFCFAVGLMAGFWLMAALLGDEDDETTL